MIQFDEHIFQRARNHQLVYVHQPTGGDWISPDLLVPGAGAKHGVLAVSFLLRLGKGGPQNGGEM